MEYIFIYFILSFVQIIKYICFNLLAIKNSIQWKDFSPTSKFIYKFTYQYNNGIEFGKDFDKYIRICRLFLKKNDVGLSRSKKSFFTFVLDFSGLSLNLFWREKSKFQIFLSIRWREQNQCMFEILDYVPKTKFFLYLFFHIFFLNTFITFLSKNRFQLFHTTYTLYVTFSGIWVKVLFSFPCMQTWVAILLRDRYDMSAFLTLYQLSYLSHLSSFTQLWVMLP